jgi:two-component system, sensor histidine kinase and response regulator
MIRRIIFLIVIVGLIAVSSIYVLEQIDETRFRQEQRVAVVNALSTVRARLEGAITGNLLLVTGLIAEFSINPKITQLEFARYARIVLAQKKHK